MKSILQTERKCFLCGKLEPLHEHHVINGPKRKRSTKFGMTLMLCPTCHQQVHENQDLDLTLKKYGQGNFELLYGHDIWMKEFGKNYL